VSGDWVSYLRLRLAALSSFGGCVTFLASRRGCDPLKAIVITQYGPPLEVLQLTDVATPVPAEDEVLIRLYTASVNPLDGFTIRGPLFFFPRLGRLLKPKHKIAGADFAGRVESVGRDIKQFSRATKCSGHRSQQKAWEDLLNMFAPVNTAWP
jgi:hypothetical protein